MSPEPSSLQQVIFRVISGELWLFLKGKTCQVFSAPFNVRLLREQKEDTVVQPDICVICEPEKINKKAVWELLILLWKYYLHTTVKRKLK